MNKKTEEFLDAIFVGDPLDYAIEHIQKNMTPEEVFTEDQLLEWANDFGMVQE